MTTLVTGGTGLVGSRLLRHLVKAGIECRALVRPGKDTPAGVTCVEGDLFNTAALNQAVEGVSAVIHLAAVFRTRDESAIWRANLEGTRSLIAAVQQHERLSTAKAKSGILMNVHSIPPKVLVARHNQLLRFKSNGQPERSQVAHSSLGLA